MTEVPFGKVIQKIERRIQQKQITAVQVVIARNGKIIVERALGTMSRDADAPPIKLDSPFLVASITKPVTATAVMILVERDKININDPVKKYIPEFIGGDRDKITIKNLLNHTSGLPDMLPDNEALRKKNTPLKDFVPRICTTPLLFTPGTQVKYQSMGIALLGEIIERVIGTQLRDFMKKEIFDPLKMKNTFLGMGKRELSSLVMCDVEETPGDAGYARWDWNSLYWRDFGAPWGGLHSTASDLAILLQTFLNGGEYNGIRIVKELTVREMTRNQAEGLNSPWGLGWGMAKSLAWTYFGKKVSETTFGHCGATGTVFWADPVRQLIFVCLTSRPLEKDKGRLFNNLSNMVAEESEW